MPQSEAPEDWEALAALEPGGHPQAEQFLLTSIETLLLKKPADQRRQGQRHAAILLAEWRREQGMDSDQP